MKKNNLTGFLHDWIGPVAGMLLLVTFTIGLPFFLQMNLFLQLINK